MPKKNSAFDFLLNRKSEKIRSDFSFGQTPERIVVSEPADKLRRETDKSAGLDK